MHVHVHVHVKNLSPTEIRILKSFLRVLLPRSNKIPVDVDEIKVVESLEVQFKALPRLIRIHFKLGFRIFQWGGLLYGAKPFTWLSPARQVGYLDFWERIHFYPLRMMLRLLISMCYVNYYSQPEVYQCLGYSLPPVTVKRERAESNNLVIFPKKDIFLKTEVCVIGSGAGGAVAAKHLAAHGHEVVILEEGDFFDVNNFNEEPYDIVRKAYRDGGFETTIGFPLIITPTGRAVGGTTLINSGTCFRLPENVLEKWNEQWGLDISYKELAPYFEDVEKTLHIEEAKEDVLGNIGLKVKKGIEVLGLQGHPLRRNAPGCQGAGRCCFGCPTEAKKSTNLNYIPEALRHGAQLYANCRAETIIPKYDYGAEVIGTFVDPKTGQKCHQIHIKAEILILAGGSLQTPLLIKKNQLLLHNSHVGRHLTIHPAAKVIARFDEDIEGWKGIPQGYCMDEWREAGINFEGAFTPPAYSAAAVSVSRQQHRSLMENYRQCASFGFLVSDSGQGRVVRLPTGDPLVLYNLHRQDLEKFKKGIRLLCQIFFAAGAREIYTGIHPLPRVNGMEDLVIMDQLKMKRTDLDLGAFHPLGTCRMGSKPNQSVVGPFGEVHGLKNIFIADGSVFPSSLGVNPMVTIMAFAARSADHVHRRLTH